IEVVWPHPAPCPLSFLKLLKLLSISIFVPAPFSCLPLPPFRVSNYLHLCTLPNHTGFLSLSLSLPLSLSLFVSLSLFLSLPPLSLSLSLVPSLSLFLSLSPSLHHLL